MGNFYSGRCHCGNLTLRFQTARTPEELGVRRDTCSFCSKHQVHSTSDPAGMMFIEAEDRSLVERYRFGTRTADFLICRRCGVYVGAVMPDARIGVVNVNVLDERAAFLALPLKIADLDGETLEERMARRKSRWTPVGSFFE
jgi:hypothetical protein